VVAGQLQDQGVPDEEMGTLLRLDNPFLISSIDKHAAGGLLLSDSGWRLVVGVAIVLEVPVDWSLDEEMNSFVVDTLLDRRRIYKP